MGSHREPKGWSLYLRIVAKLLITGATGVAKSMLPGGQRGTAGESRQVGDQFIVVDYGYDRDAVTFLAVRNWPASGGSNRADDDRFDLMSMPPRFRTANGIKHTIAPRPHVYFFDEMELTSFPIEMTEDDLEDVMAAFNDNRLTDYREMLPLIRQFELTAR